MMNTTIATFDDVIDEILNQTSRFEEYVDDEDYDSNNYSYNEINNYTLAPPLCVLCTYRLEPWLKGARVGFGSLIVLANLVIFFCLQRAKGLTTSLKLFLSNVSVVDGLYGLGFLYHSAIVDYPAFIVMNLECKLRYGFLCMVSMVAMFTLMAMCLERVLALLFPFSYRRIVTKTNLAIALVFFWLIPLASVLPAYVFIDQRVGECNFVRFIAARSFLVFSVMYFTFMVVTVICQCILYVTAKSQIKKILPTLLGDHRKQASFKMTVKATSTTLSMAVPFVVCSTPKIVTYMYLAFNPNQRLRIESLTTLAITVYLNVSHSLVNPFIYIWRLPQVRTQFLSLFPWKDSSSFSSRDDPKRELDGKKKETLGSSFGTKSDKELYWAESLKTESKDYHTHVMPTFMSKFPVGGNGEDYNGGVYEGDTTIITEGHLEKGVDIIITKADTTDDEGGDVNDGEYVAPPEMKAPLTRQDSISQPDEDAVNLKRKGFKRGDNSCPDQIVICSDNDTDRPDDDLSNQGAHKSRHDMKESDNINMTRNRVTVTTRFVVRGPFDPTSCVDGDESEAWSDFLEPDNGEMKTLHVCSDDDSVCHLPRVPNSGSNTIDSDMSMTDPGKGEPRTRNKVIREGYRGNHQGQSSESDTEARNGFEIKGCGGKDHQLHLGNVVNGGTGVEDDESGGDQVQNHLAALKHGKSQRSDNLVNGKEKTRNVHVIQVRTSDKDQGTNPQNNIQESGQVSDRNITDERELRNGHALDDWPDQTDTHVGTEIKSNTVSRFTVLYEEENRSVDEIPRKGSRVEQLKTSRSFRGGRMVTDKRSDDMVEGSIGVKKKFSHYNHERSMKNGQLSHEKRHPLVRSLSGPLKSPPGSELKMAETGREKWVVGDSRRSLRVRHGGIKEEKEEEDKREGNEIGHDTKWEKGEEKEEGKRAENNCNEKKRVKEEKKRDNGGNKGVETDEEGIDDGVQEGDKGIIKDYKGIEEEDNSKIMEGENDADNCENEGMRERGKEKEDTKMEDQGFKEENGEQECIDVFSDAFDDSGEGNLYDYCDNDCNYVSDNENNND